MDMVSCPACGKLNLLTLINIPSDRPIFEGEIATYWLDADGILISVSKPLRRTVANITANVALVKRITGGKPVPLLIYLSSSPVPDKETRAFSAEQLPNIYTAMAMLSDAGLATLIMNLLFRFRPPPIPMRNFNNEQAAKHWLKQYV